MYLSSAEKQIYFRDYSVSFPFEVTCDMLVLVILQYILPADCVLCSLHFLLRLCQIDFKLFMCSSRLKNGCKIYCEGACSLPLSDSAVSNWLDYKPKDLVLYSQCCTLPRDLKIKLDSFLLIHPAIR